MTVVHPRYPRHFAQGKQIGKVFVACIICRSLQTMATTGRATCSAYTVELVLPGLYVRGGGGQRLPLYMPSPPHCRCLSYSIVSKFCFILRGRGNNRIKTTAFEAAN